MERKEVFQYMHTTTIPRDAFIKNVLENKSLDYDDLRVCMLLMTELDGWSMSRKEARASAKDPLNYKKVHVDKIAKKLDMKKKDVKESIKVLIREDIIEKGESIASVNGYRFTF